MRLPDSQPSDYRIRETVNGALWQEWSSLLLHETAHEIVLAIPAGARIRKPTTNRSEMQFLSQWISGEWVLHEAPWEAPGILRIVPKMEDYDLWLFPPTDAYREGVIYVNMQRTPLLESAAVVTQDRILDAVIDVERETFELKDEDELHAAIELGLLTIQRAELLMRRCTSIASTLTKGVLPYISSLSSAGELLELRTEAQDRRIL